MHNREGELDRLPPIPLYRTESYYNQIIEDCFQQHKIYCECSLSVYFTNLIRHYVWKKLLFTKHVFSWVARSKFAAKVLLA
uniref:Uncharacterized protein n=1 Tax=Pyxicephalus adspersus TaxID=30357 RepID=A0AAV3AGH6_PYXAD|nr:TPA: hypothetical protein GDO54_013110 [Pyxicephalus adspersus]